jgi:hypothetical protein
MSVHLFVRRHRDVTPVQANRCTGVIVAVESHRGIFNRDRSWWDGVSCEKQGFLWLPLPGMWEERETRETIRFLGSVRAVAVVVNAEPRSPKHRPRWEDGHRKEAADYMAIVREAATEHGLEVGFSSWARPSARRSFPWAEFVTASDFTIPQPYEVHGRSGSAYVDACLEEYRALGSHDTWTGRGAHELDRSDSDAWRTPAQIAEHRESTPAGAKEAWWLPAGRLPGRVLDAILADRDPARVSTAPAPAPFERAEIAALAAKAKPSDPDAAAVLLEALDVLDAKR